MCDFKIMNGSSNYYHFKDGLCCSCSVAGEVMACTARKYTAFKVNEAHVFPAGTHICKAGKPKSEQISLIVQKALSVEPYATPARVQSAVVLDALRRQKPLVEVMQLINSVISRKAISNEIIKNKNQWRNGGDSVFDAIRGFKKYLETEPEGKFLI